jgi:hypothetical protein
VVAFRDDAAKGHVAVRANERDTDPGDAPAAGPRGAHVDVSELSMPRAPAAERTAASSRLTASKLCAIE